MLDHHKMTQDGKLEWQWCQPDQIQTISTLFWTDNHASALLLNFFTGWMFFMTPNLHDTQPTVSEHLTAINGKVKFKYIIIIIS